MRLSVRVAFAALALALVGAGRAENLIRGPYPLLVTPWTADAKLDQDVLVREADYVSGCGVGGIIWPTAGEVIGNLSPAEYEAGLRALARRSVGKRYAARLTAICPGKTSAAALACVKTAQRIADETGAKMAILARPPDDATNQTQIAAHYEAVAQVTKLPVIIQTFNGAKKSPQPDVDVIVRLARAHPDIYGYVKEESPGLKVNARMAELLKHPEIKTVLSGWGGKGWMYQGTKIGTRGVISQRPAYASLFVRVYNLICAGRASDDPELASTYAKYLYMCNLGDTFAETDDTMRGPHLYVLQRLGLFTNRLTRDGRGKVTDFPMTDAEKREVDERMRYCGLLKFGLSASTDRADALYRVGEEAVFTLTATDVAGGKVAAGKLRVTVDDWCRHTLVDRTVDLAKENPFTVRGTLREPGFLCLRATGDGLEKPFVRGVAFEPKRIEPGGTCPDDFDAFWASAQAKLEAEVPIDPKLVHCPDRSTAAYDFWRVSFATAGGRRVWGFLSVPKDRSKAPYPVSFEVASAGEGRWTMDMSSGASDRIRMYFTVHAFEPPATVEELLVIRRKLSEDLKRRYGVGSYSAAGIAASREDYYFYWSILGINRAANWLWNRPDVDRTRFNYTGGSQGGGFGLYLCGLNPRFTSAALYVPAIADTLGSLKGRVCGFPYVLEMNRTPDRAAAALRNAPYFNGAFFARRMKCPVRVSIGFIDEICPPPGIYAAYNSIGSADKGIVHGLVRGHGTWPEAGAVRDWQERNFFARPAK